MAPGTNIGAAAISVDGGPMDPTMAEKIANYSAAYARALATTTGHNADWAEQAVRASVTLTERRSR